jgi:DNA-directed RNA polymerase subunit RPC12/RpoP
MKAEENDPKDFHEFLVHFPDEKPCWNYMLDIWWSDGYVCHQCGSFKYLFSEKHKIHSSVCGKEFSIPSGILFQD